MAGPANQTMVYTVDLGDGRVVDLEGPPGATPEQLQAFVQASGQDLAPQTPGQPAAAPQGAQLDNSGTAQIGGLPDELPVQASSSMAPEDAAHVTQLLQAGKDDEAVQFMAGKGFAFGNLKEIQDARAALGKVNPDKIYQLPDLKPEQLPSDLQPGADMAAGRGAADAVPGIGHITAFTRALDSKLGLDHPTNRSFWDEYDYQSDLGKGAEQGDEENHPWSRMSGQLLGGLAIPVGLEGVGLKAGTEALRAGASMREARVAAKIAVRNRLAAAGGGYGAAHGALGADTPGEAVAGGLTEGTIGAVTGGVLGSMGRARPGPVAPTEGQQVMQAADRIGMDVLPADVGGPTTRRLTGAAAQAPISASPIINAAARVIEQGKGVRDTAAAAIGKAADPEEAGQAAEAGGKAYLKSTASRIGRIYDGAAKMSGDIRLPLPTAKAELDAQIARLKEVPGGGVGLEDAEALRKSLNGNFTVQGIRDMRTEMFVKPDFRGTPVERRLRRIVDAAAQDIEQGLSDAGKADAARAFKAADKQWRERLATIERVIEPIIGTATKPKSGEEIMGALQRAGKGNAVRLGVFLKSLPADEASMVRASIIGHLGHATEGAQNAAGDAFSMSKFLTDYNKLGTSAKNAIFGQESRAALDDLAVVAGGTKAAQQYANHSNTSGGMWGNVGALMGLGSVAPKTAAVSLVGQLITGRLLASPRFARWLARAPRTQLSPQAYTERLSRIARAEPAIANEVLQLQQRLADTFTSAPTRLAADEAPDGVAGTQGNAGDQSGQQEGLQP